MTDQELKHLRDLCDKATPGPWNTIMDGDGKHSGVENRNQEIVPRYTPYEDSGIYKEEDAEFIAESRTVIPKLLDEVERLRETLKFYADPKSYQLSEITYCLSGHWWVSPPVICPHCDNQKLRARVEKLREGYEKLLMSEFMDGLMAMKFARKCLAQDDEMEGR